MSEEDKKEPAKKPEVKKPGPKAATYSTICKGYFHILGVEIFDGFKLDAKNKANKDFMKRFEHGIKIGIIKKD